VLLLAAALVFVIAGAPAQTADNWMINGIDWYATNEEKPHEVPEPGSVLQPGQRISTARGQGIELYVGKNRIALRPSTVVIVGDDDPATPIGTFELVSGAISVTVYKGSFATIDAPRLKATSKGADFAITTSVKDSEVTVDGGAVTVLSLANGASTEVGADQVAIVGQKALNERTGLADPVILPVARTKETTPRVVDPKTLVQSLGNDPAGPYAKGRVADGVWVTNFIRENKVTSTWIVKGISSSAGFGPDGKSGLNALPRPGTVLISGMSIKTGREDEIELTNGHDLVRMKWNTTLVMGDDDPLTANPNFQLIAGVINVQVSDHEPGQTVSIATRHLTTTVESAECMVATGPEKSAVTVMEGAAAVASLAGGQATTVNAGQSAVVKPQQ
jgi:FecR protein